MRSISGTLALVWVRRFEAARLSASVAVAAIVAGWALAQSPLLLKGLTVEDAAAGRSVLIAVIVAVGLGALLLLPSLALLFGLLLRGRFDAPAAEDSGETGPAPRFRPELGAVAAGALGVGSVFLFFFDSGWAHAIGVISLFVFLAVGFLTLTTVVAGSAD
jgi:cytochrome d ubiquinol oxidase subunit II